MNVITVTLIGPDNARSVVSISNDTTVRDVATSKYDLIGQTTKRNGKIVDPVTTKVTDGDTVTIEQMSEPDWHIRGQGSDMRDQTYCGMLSIRFASLVSILLAANLFALSQAIPSERTAKDPRSPLSQQAERSEAPSSISVFNPVKPKRLEETYYAITPGQRFRWFVTGTVGPAHLAGVAFVSACGTAVNRPGEYGTHWAGFADRLGIGVAGSALGNAMEASGGLVLGEDPRYFRVPQQPFRARVGNVVRLTFLARSRDGGVKPAYARYVGVFGSNFLSNTWRVRSEANAQDALLRSSEGLAGRMAANAFGEFWPDLKKYFFHKRNQSAQQRLKNAD